MSQLDPDRYRRFVYTQPEMVNAQVDHRRRSILHRGIGTNIGVGLGIVILACIPLSWILDLTGVI